MANRSSNKAAVPEAKGALDKFKYEVATELGVPLTDGYNGDLTSRQNGSVGGYISGGRPGGVPLHQAERHWCDQRGAFVRPCHGGHPQPDPL